MKLEMTLPEQPGFLHAVPILNIFALIQLFFLLGPALVLQSGVAVDLAPSRFQMEPGEPEPRIHLGRDAVTKSELAARLEGLHEDGASTKSIVLLQTDTGTPVGIERAVTDLILSKGFRLAIVGKNAPGAVVPTLKKADK
jgi:hypothetical protein